MLQHTLHKRVLYYLYPLHWKEVSANFKLTGLEVSLQVSYDSHWQLCALHEYIQPRTPQLCLLVQLLWRKKEAQVPQTSVSVRVKRTLHITV